jgi:hypothetical protein
MIAIRTIAQRTIPGVAEETLLDADRERAWRAMLKGHALLVGRLDADLRAHVDMSLID